MAKERRDIKKIIYLILIVLGGIAFTASSFCVYYLVKPRHTALLVGICIVDYLYTLFTSCALIKLKGMDKWLLKGLYMSIAYIVAFIAVATFTAAVSISHEYLGNHIIDIIYYSFFSGPSILLMMAILLVILYGLH